MLIAFDGVARPIALEGCAHLQASLATVLRGWRFEPVAAGADPIITIRKIGETYSLESPSLGPPCADLSDVGAVCAFIADLVQIYIAEQPSLLCLHCGAAAFGGGLAIFPNQYRAGKSTLLARLAAAGVPVFADDVLPIAGASDDGIALGVAPRLRLPLPRGASPSFRRFVHAHAGPSDSRYLYLDLPPESLAPHGRRLPIAACILLDRRPSGGAALEPAAKSAGLQRAILQNFARAVPATEIAGRLRKLVDRVPCFTLRYAALDEAVALLQEAFKDRPTPTAGGSAAPSRRRTPPTAGASSLDRPSGRRRLCPVTRRYVRDPAILLHRVDGDGFLVDPRSDSIYHLNAVAAALWRLLGESTTVAEAADILQQAFPEVDARQIRRDVRALLTDLLANGLIVPRVSDEEERTS